MNQQINLYHPIFRKEQKKFSAQTMLQASAVVVVAVVLLIGANVWQIRSLHTAVARAEGELAATTEQIETLAKLPGRSADPRLLAEQRQLEQAWSTAQLVRGNASVAGAVSSGYSEYFLGLARQHVPGLWLTAITVADGGQELVLQGRTPTPDAVPTYVQRLAREPAFAGKQFDLFEITRPMEATDKGEIRAPYLEFVIRSKYREAKPG